MASRLTTSNRAGWTFALPAVVLITMFIIVPFLFAFWLSLTNQRLISPNPTEYVGLANFRQLLTVKVLPLDPVVDEAGQPVLDEEGRLVGILTRGDIVRSFSELNSEDAEV